ncbi:MAG: RNA methyltransferase [Bacteroidales bacterium]|nr:RNA methyltransferase [Bacteroidales bacterium]
MISRSKLKELCAYRQARQCDESAVYVAEGPKLAVEAAASSASLKVCAATAAWLADHRAEADRFEQVFEISEADLERLSQQKTPAGVWMLIARPEPQPLDPDAPLLLALDRLQDPGNLGTILRIADWFGVRHVVCSDDSASPYNPKAVQASMGAVLRTNVLRVPDLGACLLQTGRTVVGADLGGSSLYTTALPARAALVVGNESRGLSQAVRQILGLRITIPNIGHTAESLNASVATGIICAEFFRQQALNR